jgi:predicted nuclease of predicted toxin-antitoxin system
MLIAVDTNVPLDLAERVEDVVDALDVIRQRILPDEEEHDSIILAESALLGRSILLTSDAHLRGIDFQQLKLLVQDFHVDAPIISTPREIVRKFCR